MASYPRMTATADFLTRWAQLAEVEVQQAFAGGTDKAAAWCLSGKEKFTLAAPAGHQKKDGWDAYIKEGDDLKKTIETAKGLAGDPGLAAWPWFINQACRPGDLNSVASDNTLAQGESQAVSFLSTLTGEDCEITGGYEENNEDVNRILAKSKDTVRRHEACNRYLRRHELISRFPNFASLTARGRPTTG